VTAFPGSLRRLVFGISRQETTFERRGFRGGSPVMRQRLEKVGGAFVGGYHAALEEGKPATLVSRLDESDLEFRGFAYEGAAMGLGLLDYLTPWNRWRVPAFLGGAGDAHTYMVHVGVGWVLARVPGSVEKFISRYDPLLRWLVVDGYGFHEGFFHWRNYLAGQPLPRRVTGYARRAFDQGLGRCLWFVDGGEVDRIARTVASLPTERRADLWSGVGLAVVYAGEASDAGLISLLESAGEFQPQLRQGAAFAAKARQRAGNLTPYTEQACVALCGMSARDAARLTDATLENLPTNQPEPAYEIWRGRIQARFAGMKPARSFVSPVADPPTQPIKKA